MEEAAHRPQPTRSKRSAVLDNVQQFQCSAACLHDAPKLLSGAQKGFELRGACRRAVQLTLAWQPIWDTSYLIAGGKVPSNYCQAEKPHGLPSTRSVWELVSAHNPVVGVCFASPHTSPCLPWFPTSVTLAQVPTSKRLSSLCH